MVTWFSKWLQGFLSRIEHSQWPIKLQYLLQLGSKRTHRSELRTYFSPKTCSFQKKRPSSDCETPTMRVRCMQLLMQIVAIAPAQNGTLSLAGQLTFFPLPTTMPGHTNSRDQAWQRVNSRHCVSMTTLFCAHGPIVLTNQMRYDTKRHFLKNIIYI